MINSISTRLRDATRFPVERRDTHTAQRPPDGVSFVVVSRGSSIEADVAMLIEKRYAERGLRLGATGGNQCDQELTTIAALHGSRVVATVSVRSDGPQGLLAEHLYPQEIEAHRKLGGRLCELTRLAADPEFGSQPALASLFNAAYRVAVRTYGATDFVMEVHPRHAAYYTRMAGCRIVGPETLCPRVNAPAVLLHLPSRRVEDGICVASEKQTGASVARRSIYDYLQRAAASSSIGTRWSPTWTPTSV
ncbi:N-acyl amino acid synthase FeeM domain-containing protein [Azoarcus taiwanensis]|uniref:N-acyl amino acid synthase FeeM catalytic core domain-containing protein n=1 Tax=Azoarcus taiwanensis TaxID=666964 RepID=A0A972J7L8_9RHOO|nr:hypothetical protein [Azoarcus taiwanensis]NMG01866.1 hypothetical protein [Azoarcus taiwanensis]